MEKKPGAVDWFARVMAVLGLIASLAQFGWQQVAESRKTSAELTRKTFAAFSMGDKLAESQLQLHYVNSPRPSQYRELALLNATEVKALATQLGLNLDPLELLRAENPKDSATPSTQDILERRLTAAHGAKVATAFRLGYSLAAVFYHSAAPGQDETFIVSQYRHLAPQMNKAMVDLGIQYAFDPALNSPSAISAAAKKGRDMVDSGFRQ